MSGACTHWWMIASPSDVPYPLPLPAVCKLCGEQREESRKVGVDIYNTWIPSDPIKVRLPEVNTW